MLRACGRHLLHLCELLGFSFCLQNMHRYRKAPSPFYKDQTVVFALMSAVQLPCPHKMITAFAITCLENWNKWEQTVNLPCTHCHGSLHKHLHFFPSLLCMEVLLHCMESWVDFQTWSWKALKEMAFFVSDTGPPFMIMIAYECILQKQWNCQAKEGSFWTQDLPEVLSRLRNSCNECL